MPNPRKILFKVLGGQSDANIPFNDLVRLLLRLGFDLRIRGSHHIFPSRTSMKSSISSRSAQKRSPIRSGKSGNSSANMASRIFKAPKYPISIFWSDSDKAFIARVPDLPGCMADGPSYQTALAAAEVVIRDWIETARDLGRTIPRPTRRLALS